MRNLCNKKHKQYVHMLVLDTNVTHMISVRHNVIQMVILLFMSSVKMTFHGPVETILSDLVK